MKHKYDNRGAGAEGELAENLFSETCRKYKEDYKLASVKEDCAGVDGYLNGSKVDVKARKFRQPPNTCWIEISKAGCGLRSGWVYNPKLIAQLMVYEENKTMIKAQFGIYHTNDLVKLLEEKVDFSSKVSYGQVYKLYTRWFDGLHRGTMTVIPYSDLESLPSFNKFNIPENSISKLKAFYNYEK